MDYREEKLWDVLVEKTKQEDELYVYLLADRTCIPQCDYDDL